MVYGKWTYKETSAVVFGTDADTKSKALSENDEEIEVKLIESNKEEEVETKIMAEIEKCDCVCANCHRICNYKEINSGNVGRIWGAWAIKQTPVAEAEVRK